MAHVKEPVGLAGQVRLHVYSDDPLALGGFGKWWLAAAGTSNWREVVPDDFLARGQHLIAKLPGVDDRDAAAALKGATIAVPRSAFGQNNSNEYYWADLIGLPVVNREGVELGRIADLLDLGPHQVLRLRGGAKELLIPFVAAYVDEVDVKAGLVKVDWGLDYQDW
ncbi:MAG: ribosome maturation factor RimM [Burkholderiales bacterium]